MSGAAALVLDPTRGHVATEVTRVDTWPRHVPFHIVGRIAEHIAWGREVFDLMDPVAGEGLPDFVRIFTSDLLPDSPTVLRAGAQRRLAEFTLHRVLELSYEVEDSVGDSISRYFQTLSAAPVDRAELAREEAARIFADYRTALANRLLEIRGKADAAPTSVRMFWAIQDEVSVGVERGPLETGESYESRVLEAIDLRISELEAADQT